MFVLPVLHSVVRNRSGSCHKTLPSTFTYARPQTLPLPISARCRFSLARVSVVRCEGTLAGTPCIDDYVRSVEPVMDYLTRYSGLLPGDLDPATSSHYLTTLKHAYLKLRWVQHNQMGLLAGSRALYHIVCFAHVGARCAGGSGSSLQAGCCARCVASASHHLDSTCFAVLVHCVCMQLPIPDASFQSGSEAWSFK